MKSISILGSTGSIGTNTLDVVRRQRDRFTVHALTTYGKVEMLANQIEEFRPAVVCVGDADAAARLHRLGSWDLEILHGPEGLVRIAEQEDYDILVSSLVGFAGVLPTLAAIRAGHDIALANKETLVAAGEVIMNMIRSRGVRLVPIDSEHSAILQSLAGEDPASIHRLILTASGGPFRGRCREDLHSVTKTEALRHPNWSMGAKISIDSATLMNKGLEVIEAHWLFHVPASLIDVVIHPQSVIHSMVEFVDGSVKAQLGVPDMRAPIQYALTWPDRGPLDTDRLDWTTLRSLTFEKPDPSTFRCLALAYQALDAGGTTPACMNAANEVAVAAFLREDLRFLDIPNLIEEVLSRHVVQPAGDIDTILEIDHWARATAESLIAERGPLVSLPISPLS